MLKMGLVGLLPPPSILLYQISTQVFIYFKFLRMVTHGFSLNFYVSIEDFYVSYLTLLFKNCILVYTRISVLTNRRTKVTANRKDFTLRSESEARRAAYRVVQWVLRTPSAADKLPKYILEEIDMMELYADNHGWGFLDE